MSTIEARSPGPGRGRARPRRFHVSRSNLFLYLPLVLWAAITLYPFAFIVLVSVRSLLDFYTHPFGLPRHWDWANYREAWTQAQVPRFALNSLIVSVVSTLILLAVATPAAFALSRFRFRLRPLIWFYLMIGLFVPELARIVPIVIVAHDLHLSNSLQGLSLVYAASGVPFSVFLLAAFMQSLPDELEEVAVVDGAGVWRVFREVILPLSRPAIITVATFQMLNSWNEYILARLLISSPNLRTLPLGVSMLLDQYSTHIPAFAAAMVIALIPAVVIFSILQRYVVSGITDGALRG
jgi:raffinose/stachyose/melibiose transport system permease protein